MAIFYAILIIIVLAVGALYLSRFFIKKAMRDVVAVFRAQGATNPKGAMSPQALGLVRGNFMDRMFRLRDYKPDALRLLGQADIVRATEDGRLYLSEEALESSAVKKFAGIQ